MRPSQTEKEVNWNASIFSYFHWIIYVLFSIKLYIPEFWWKKFTAIFIQIHFYDFSIAMKHSLSLWWTSWASNSSTTAEKPVRSQRTFSCNWTTSFFPPWALPNRLITQTSTASFSSFKSFTLSPDAPSLSSSPWILPFVCLTRMIRFQTWRGMFRSSHKNLENSNAFQASLGADNQQSLRQPQQPVASCIFFMSISTIFFVMPSCSYAASRARWWD